MMCTGVLGTGEIAGSLSVADNRRMDDYYNKDVQKSPDGYLIPTKDGDIALLDPESDFDHMMTSSNRDTSLEVGSKLKKKLRWRWRWKRKNKETSSLAVTQFSHNPPGHTCGLPCCSHDNENQQIQHPTSQRGCVPVPLLSVAELSESNFIMKRSPFVPAQVAAASKHNEKSKRDGNVALISVGEGDVSKNNGSVVNISNGAEFINQSSNLNQHRNQQALSPWERQRHITLPDCPQRQHTIMFLNHQPGETSDFNEADIRNARAINEKETGGVIQIVLQHQSTDSTPDINQFSSYSFPTHDAPSRTPLNSYLSNSQDAGSGTHKKRLAHSKLPDVPIENKDSLGNVGHEEGQRSRLLDDDDAMTGDNTSAFDDHVYDVLSEVKEYADKLSQKDPVAVSETYPAFSISEVNPFSDLDSLTYQDTDSIAGSYVYNGSLVSHYTNDTDSTLHYPGLITKNRYFTNTNFDYPSSLLQQGHIKGRSRSPSVLFQDQQLDSISRAQVETYGGKIICDPTDDSQNKIEKRIYNSRNGIDFSIQNMNIRVDECDMNNKRSLLTEGYGLWPDLGTSVSSGLDLDRDTKLRLWDLRMITINTEQNHYSTFPLRKFTSDELSVGQFSRTQDLGYRHRHNSDVSTDNYVTHKIERILRAPVLTKYIHSERPNLPLVDKSPKDIFEQSNIKFDPQDSSLNSWKQFFNEKHKEFGLKPHFVHDSLSDSSSYTLSSNWTRPWTKDSVYEPITLSGIYKQATPWCRKKSINSIDSFNSSKNSPDSLSQHGKIAVLDIKSNSSTHNSDGISLCSGTDLSTKDYIPCGSVTSRSSSGSKVQDKRNSQNIFTNVRSESSEKTYKVGKDQDHKRGPLIWGRGDGHVDWRRQAELYRENRPITLIL